MSGMTDLDVDRLMRGDEDISLKEFSEKSFILLSVQDIEGFRKLVSFFINSVPDEKRRKIEKIFEFIRYEKLPLDEFERRLEEAIDRLSVAEYIENPDLTHSDGHTEDIFGEYNPTTIGAIENEPLTDESQGERAEYALVPKKHLETRFLNKVLLPFSW